MDYQTLKSSHQNRSQFHKIILTISWCVLANFSIFFSMYRYRIYAYYLHVILSWIITSLTISMTLLIIISDGVDLGAQDKSIQLWHDLIGITVLLFVIFQFLLGMLTRITFQKSLLIRRIRNAHKVSGYILILFCKIEVFIGWYKRYQYKNQSTFFFVLLWEIVWICIFICRKLMLFPSLEQNIIYQPVETLTRIRKIQKLSQVSKYTNIILFANYVYDATPLYQHHPGGYQVIQAVRGRDIDRFLYGMYSPEKIIQIGIHSHSYRSLQLLGNPIAKLQIPSTFLGMNSVNICKIVYKQNYNNHFSVLGLQNIDEKNVFVYTGYNSLKQLGRYYALNVGRTTRLYTVVNCIRRQNLITIREILIKIMQMNKAAKNYLQNQQRMNEQDQQNQIIDKTINMKLQLLNTKNFKKHNQKIDNNEIPIIFKIYPQGKLTPLLNNLRQNSHVQITQQRGTGMKLDTIQAGLLIFVAGGTGLYPFMDLIDLLFKNTIICRDIHQQLLKQNPILQKQNFFQKFSFKFYIAVKSMKDIHPLTLFQLNYLAQQNRQNFICCIRISDKITLLRQSYPYFSFTQDKFNEILTPILQQAEFSKLFVCGPPSMGNDMIKLMEEQNISSDKYMMM